MRHSSQPHAEDAFKILVLSETVDNTQITLPPSHTPLISDSQQFGLTILNPFASQPTLRHFVKSM